MFSQSEFPCMTKDGKIMMESASSVRLQILLD